MSDSDFEDFEEFEDLNQDKRSRQEKELIRRAVKEFASISLHWSDKVYKSCEFNTHMPAFEDVLEQMRQEVENMCLDKVALAKRVSAKQSVQIKPKIPVVTKIRAVTKIVGDVATTSADSNKPRSFRDALVHGKPVLPPSSVTMTVPKNPWNIMGQKGEVSKILVTCRTFSDLSKNSDCLTPRIPPNHNTTTQG